MSNAPNAFDAGQRATLSLAATISSDWLTWDVIGGSLSIRVQFTAADAVGTLAVESYPGQTVAFADEAGDIQTSLPVGAALDGTSHEFVLENAPRNRYRLTYTRTGGGAADSIVASWS